jgi:hypothetical protein
MLNLEERASVERYMVIRACLWDHESDAALPCSTPWLMNLDEYGKEKLSCMYELTLIQYIAVMDRGPFERCAVEVTLSRPSLKAISGRVI